MPDFVQCRDVTVKLYMSLIENLDLAEPILCYHVTYQNSMVGFHEDRKESRTGDAIERNGRSIAIAFSRRISPVKENLF